MLICQSPAYQFENKVESISGNLSITVDGALEPRLFRIGYHPMPMIYPFEHEDKLYILKEGENEIEIHVCFLGLPNSSF